MKNDECYHGVLPLNKPVGISSHDAVLEVRRTINQKGIGHTGTLDPRAEGLLILCLGRATKAARFLSDCDKTYDAEIHLGLTSPTHDAEGVDPTAQPSHIPEMTIMDIRQLLAEFEGKSLQKVPAFSAVQVNGRRLYELARQGKAVQAPVREIDISRMSLLSYTKPFLKIQVACSKGTYIRSIAHSIGERIGCGAYLSALTRLSVGDLQLQAALTLDRIAEYHRSGELAAHLLSLDRVLEYGTITVTDEFGRSIVNGPTLQYCDVVGIDGQFGAGDVIMLKGRNGTVLAIGTAGVESSDFKHGTNGNLFKYMRVLN